jgi:hypothetical protein
MLSAAKHLTFRNEILRFAVTPFKMIIAFHFQ